MPTNALPAQTINAAPPSVSWSSGHAEDYISDFRIYASKSGITADEALSEYFKDSLHPRLLVKIFTMEKLPVKIADWFIAASKYDLQWRRTRAIIGKI